MSIEFIELPLLGEGLSNDTITDLHSFRQIRVQRWMNDFCTYSQYSHQINIIIYLLFSPFIIERFLLKKLKLNILAVSDETAATCDFVATSLK